MSYQLQPLDELLESSEFYRLALNQLNEGVYVCDDAHRIVFWNCTMETLTGVVAKEALRKRPDEVFCFHSEQEVSKQFEAAYTGVASNAVDFSYHVRITGKFGWANGMYSPLWGNGGKQLGVIALVRAIPEKDALALNLMNAQRLEALGLLVGGIAHDFNNLLTSLFGFLELAQEYPDAPEEVSLCIERARAVSARTSNLAKQLLALTKRGCDLKEVTDIGPVVRQAVDFALSGSNVSAIFDLAEDLWPCEINTGQIEQALNNVIINARQSMPSGGHVTVKAENLTIEADNKWSLKPGSYVYINLKDQGEGIAKEHLARVFEPFFTTKQKSSGLGLSTTYTIVKDHQGRIYIDSPEEEGGTIVHLFFPARISVSLVHQALSDETLPTIPEKKRILAIDDDSSLVEVVKKMLESCGYSVSTATSARHGLFLFEQALAEETQFDLVIVDLTLAGGPGGTEVFRQMRSLYPEVKAIVTSGYSDDPNIKDPLGHGFVASLKKPFTRRRIIQVVGEALTGQGKYKPAS